MQILLDLSDTLTTAPGAFDALFSRHLRVGYPRDSHFCDGSEHNGACRMVVEARPSRQLFLKPTSGGAAKLCLNAQRMSPEVAATAGRTRTGDVAIRYASAAVHARTEIIVDDVWPRWEVHARVAASPLAPGVWPALWLSGTGDTWPPEVDIFELKVDERGAAGVWCNTMQGRRWDDPARRDDCIVRDASPAAISDPDAPAAYGARLELLPGTADVRVTYLAGGRELGSHVGVGYKGAPMALIANLQLAAHAEVEEAYFELHALQVLRWGGPGGAAAPPPPARRPDTGEG